MKTKQDKTNLTRVKGPVFERVWKHGECGYKNELWSQARAVAVCHLFIICRSHVSTSYVFVTQEALACCYCVAYNILGEFRETLKITEKKVGVGSDFI